MSLFRWQTLKKLPEILDLRMPDEAQQLARIRLMERNLGLPIKAAVIIVLFYYLFFSNWFDTTITTVKGLSGAPHEIALETVRQFFVIYLIVNAGLAAFFVGMHHWSLQTIQRVVFMNGWFDALFLGTLTVVTDGFDSFLYWVFLGLIVRNTISIPAAGRQISLNFFVALAYILAGVVGIFLSSWEADMMGDARTAIEPTNPTEPFFLRIAVLFLLTLCCYGVQVLLEKQHRAEESSREFALRQEQLQATGRLAAEIAHQLKNPMSIINNAAFTLQRTIKEGKTITQQIKIIREEVDRSDRILTELMGYARLSEGQVEKLDLGHELDYAIERVFPAGAKYEVTILRNYAAALPPLLAQRAHISEVFVNILQNAREAMGGTGQIEVSASYGENYSLVVQFKDNGPGIPQEKLSRIFEPYFTTKEKGTGLGLAIVKHNTELYNGSVRVESEIGKGTTFIVTLPAKTVFNIKK
jgi:signal transduction histidine kinase